MRVAGIEVAVVAQDHYRTAASLQGASFVAGYDAVVLQEVDPPLAVRNMVATWVLQAVEVVRNLEEAGLHAEADIVDHNLRRADMGCMEAGEEAADTEEEGEEEVEEVDVLVGFVSANEDHNRSLHIDESVLQVQAEDEEAVVEPTEEHNYVAEEEEEPLVGQPSKQQ